MMRSRLASDACCTLHEIEYLPQRLLAQIFDFEKEAEDA